jgi:hypothetical protein
MNQIFMRLAVHDLPPARELFQAALIQRPCGLQGIAPSQRLVGVSQARRMILFK